MAASPLALSEALANGASSLTFKEVAQGIDEKLHVSEGYDAQVLIRWGDKVLADAPAFDPKNQTAAAQAKQFGYNNDFIGYFPLPFGTKNSDGGLLVVNHEYTIPFLMFEGMTEKSYMDLESQAHVDIEMAAHGASVVEVRKHNGRWSVVDKSPFARRVTATSPMRISGPAAGHDRLKTKADTTGRRVLGTINNCAGGKTPWGTVLTAEENFNNYFSGDASKTKEAKNYARLGFAAKSRYAFSKFDARFDVEQHAFDLHAVELNALLGEAGFDGFVGRAAGLRARLLVAQLIGFTQRTFGQGIDLGFKVDIARRGLPIPHGLARFTHQFVDGVDGHLALFVAIDHGAEHDFFGQLQGFGFDHEHCRFGARDHEVHLAVFALGLAGVEHVFTVDVTHAGCADGTIERNA